jgi:hypothetical protein
VRVGKGIAAGLIASLALASVALAGAVEFEGATKTNSAPVNFRVTMKHGRYRTIKEFDGGDMDKGIEIDCDMSGHGESTFEYTDPIKVKPDGTYKSGSHAFDIRGKFVSESKSKGTIEVTYNAFGNHCASGPVEFVATRN